MSHNLTLNQIAKICHETNRALCQAYGDMSQPVWEEAPKWQQDSAISGVLFHFKNPEAGPEHSHEEWLRIKVAEGWVCGPVKKPEVKQHPCMVPYDQLPPEQKAKDYIFRSLVHSLK